MMLKLQGAGHELPVGDLDEDDEKTRELISQEEEAANQYEMMADDADSDDAKHIYNDIADEEKVHAGELFLLLLQEDPSDGKGLKEGMKEASEELSEKDEDEDDDKDQDSADLDTMRGLMDTSFRDLFMIGREKVENKANGKDSVEKSLISYRVRPSSEPVPRPTKSFFEWKKGYEQNKDNSEWIRANPRPELTLDEWNSEASKYPINSDDPKVVTRAKWMKNNPRPGASTFEEGHTDPYAGIPPEQVANIERRLGKILSAVDGEGNFRNFPSIANDPSIPDEEKPRRLAAHLQAVSGMPIQSVLNRFDKNRKHFDQDLHRLQRNYIIADKNKADNEKLNVDNIFEFQLYLMNKYPGMTTAQAISSEDKAAEKALSDQKWKNDTVGERGGGGDDSGGPYRKLGSNLGRNVVTDSKSRVDSKKRQDEFDKQELLKESGTPLPEGPNYDVKHVHSNSEGTFNVDHIEPEKKPKKEPPVKTISGPEYEAAKANKTQERIRRKTKKFNRISDKHLRDSAKVIDKKLDKKTDSAPIEAPVEEPEETI